MNQSISKRYIRRYVPLVTQAQGEGAIRIAASLCQQYKVPLEASKELCWMCLEHNRYRIASGYSREPGAGLVEAQEVKSELNEAEASLLLSDIRAKLKELHFSDEDSEGFLAMHRMLARHRAIQFRLRDRGDSGAPN